MPGGHPTIGGTNGVPVLDFGQDGGARDAAGDARFSGSLIRGSDGLRRVPQGLPQQNVVFMSTMGFSGATHRLTGILRAKTAAVMAAIVAELDERKHGSLRNVATGILGAPNPTLIRESRLTDFDGAVIAARALLLDWRLTGRRVKTAEWAVVVRLAMEFEVLG